MMYLSWASFYEGEGDRTYFDILLPRLMEEITLAEGIRSVVIPDTPAVALGRRGRQVEKFAEEVCSFKASFHLLFVHADTGGRALEANLSDRGSAYCRAVHDLCEWKPVRCVVLTPRHETEAWALADPAAVAAALGFRGPLAGLNLPADAVAAERLQDPKAVLEKVARTIRGRRSRLGSSQIFTIIAQTQTMVALRRSKSFQAFEAKLRESLVDLGCLAHPSEG